MPDTDNNMERELIAKKIQKLKNSKFKQQTLKSWRPVATAMSTVLTFAIFGVIFLGMGMGLFVMSQSIFDSETQYNDVCKDYLQN